MSSGRAIMQQKQGHARSRAKPASREAKSDSVAGHGPPEWTGEASWAAFLLAATLLAYHPAWHGEFIWDDDAHVTREELRSWSGLVRIWTDIRATQQYYPVVHTAFWWQHWLFGDWPTSYHLVNIGLHALNAWLVGRFLRRLGVAGGRLAAAMFALHPVMVESVAWITELKNLLSGAFYLAAALVWLRFDAQRQRWWYVLALVLFALALGSKSVTATLPGALLVVLWWRRGRLSWQRDVLPLAPFFALGAASGLFTAWVEQELIGAKGAPFELSWVERGLLAGRVLWFYAGKLLWPAELVFIYPRWTIDASQAWQYLYPATWMAVIAAAWSLRRRWRGPLAAVLFFTGTLFPVLGFFNVYPFQFSYVADHFQYLASLGVIAPVAAGMAQLPAAASPKRDARQGPVLLGAAVCAILAALTWRQSGMYADQEALYTATLRAHPQCWMARNNLGAWLMQRMRLDEAAVQFREALRIKPDFATAHFNLGTALGLQGKNAEAIAELQEALRLQPDYAKAHHNLGAVYAQAGRPEEAMRHFAEAVRLAPDWAEARQHLARALVDLGRERLGLEQFEAALRLRPSDHGLQDEVRRLRIRLGLPQETRILDRPARIR